MVNSRMLCRRLSSCTVFPLPTESLVGKAVNSPGKGSTADRSVAGEASYEPAVGIDSSPHQYHPPSRGAAVKRKFYHSAILAVDHAGHQRGAVSDVSLVRQRRSRGAPTADHPCGEGWQFFGSAFYELVKLHEWDVLGFCSNCPLTW